MKSFVTFIVLVSFYCQGLSQDSWWTNKVVFGGNQIITESADNARGIMGEIQGIYWREPKPIMGSGFAYGLGFSGGYFSYYSPEMGRRLQTGTVGASLNITDVAYWHGSLFANYAWHYKNINLGIDANLNLFEWEYKKNKFLSIFFGARTSYILDRDQFALTGQVGILGEL